MQQYGEAIESLQILYRPRLNTLIHEGLHQPLLVMLAGPGYGKTYAMSNYVASASADVLWLRCGMLDNLSSHFWNHLIYVLSQKYPDLSSQLHGLEFPVTIPSFETFSTLVGKHFSNHRRAIWVFDDFGEITNQQIKGFIRMLVEANIDNLNLVLMSNVLETTESIAFMTNKRALILADDLRFTAGEIGELYQLYGITLEESEQIEIEQYTAGWPLSLRLLVQQHDTMTGIMRDNKKITHHTISHLFEERFFANYSREQQKLLIKLSMLDSFDFKLAISLYPGNAIELEPFGNHAFLINEPGTNRYFLHHLYRLHLQDKAYLLDQDEERQLWLEAAEYYAAAGNIIEAVSCHHKGEDYRGMMEAINQYLLTQSAMTENMAHFFLEHMADVTSELIEEYPRADFIRAYIYMDLVRLEEAEALLLSLEGRLSGISTVEIHDLLCDVYMTLGLIHMMQNKVEFADDFRKSAMEAEHLPLELLASKGKKLRLLNGHTFSMSDNQPGAKERMEQAVADAAPHMAKIWSGGLSGIDHLFTAETAYLSFDLDKALQHAYQCIYKAEAHAQHDVVCNAHFLLARIMSMQGNLSHTQDEMSIIVDCVARHNNSNGMQMIRDTALGCFYIMVRDMERIPKSIMVFSRSGAPNLTYGRPEIVYALYLLHTGEYAKLVGMLRYTGKGLYLSRGIWQERIVRLILLAVGHHYLGNPDDAMRSLWDAYDLCYHNGLVTSFIELGADMVKVIQAARHQTAYTFNPEWLDLIEREAQGYAKRSDKMRALYRKENDENSSVDNPLSKREREVLHAIARGLTREEIAVEQYVSVNTVKSTIRNIYNKLDAGNKAEAVTIAISNRYITDVKRI